jgi:hemerythrin
VNTEVEQWCLLSFVWSERFALGHLRIDAEHRAFFELFQKAAALADEGGADERLEVEFRAIVQELRQHFSAEEQIMRDLDIPGRMEHAAIHRALLEQAGATLAMGRQGRWGGALRWLAVPILEHILNEDILLKRHLVVEEGHATKREAGA